MPSPKNYGCIVRIAPKEYIGEEYIQDFYYYTKAQAWKKYKQKFPNIQKRYVTIF